MTIMKARIGLDRESASTIHAYDAEDGSTYTSLTHADGCSHTVDIFVAPTPDHFGLVSNPASGNCRRHATNHSRCYRFGNKRDVAVRDLLTLTALHGLDLAYDAEARDYSAAKDARMMKESA